MSKSDSLEKIVEYLHLSEDESNKMYNPTAEEQVFPKCPVLPEHFGVYQGNLCSYGWKIITLFNR